MIIPLNWRIDWLVLIMIILIQLWGLYDISIVLLWKTLYLTSANYVDSKLFNNFGTLEVYIVSILFEFVLRLNIIIGTL
jgi:hypothetical protein